ncbi:threonine aldolase family protein [Pseudaestuariivita atlantica]|uniref:Threonine aldolase n=1 Tax=Pseudaestuariivita atlantica TaxID=1317121 RepID=A0A0L1JSG3_9RHOB|nr:beta-eliminating lyase-related protein [Pseudaestuariivita atlantica]KNG94676.1 threonine aldolase [Pseudaestuariivita atlantica]
MFFASDNAGPAHPEVMQALMDANAGYAMPYGADVQMAEVTARIRDIFEAPEAAVFLVATGTAANALALATLCQPYQTVFCSPVAHINCDECNAPEFYTGGAKLTLVGDSHRMTPEALQTAIAGSSPSDVHVAQRGPVSITQVTECGGVYTLAELQALCRVAHDAGLPVHLDGARFTNALVALGCTPAEMSWRAGVNVVCFGGTKNGCPGVEAVIFFDPAHAREFELRRKRGAHLFSKHRYLSAQMLAYLTDDLWLRSARSANANAKRLADGLALKGAQFEHDPQANMIFARLTRAQHQAAHAAGARYYLNDGPLDTGHADTRLSARFVCDWSIQPQQIDAFLAAI